MSHAELDISGSILMLADEHPDMGFVGPGTLGGTPVSLLLYVEDVDEVCSRAVQAGAKLLRPVQNQFYGDRSGLLEDPFGHQWTVATHVEDLSHEEMHRRFQRMTRNSQ